VTIIANESQRLSRMINTFLTVTQLQRKDRQEVLKIPLRLDEVVKETIASMQTVAKKRRIRLVEQPSQRLPPVAADKSMITQAVKNLVSNAIKYSPERTTVTVTTSLEAEVVRLSVEDRGYGIPAEAMDRVWEKFYRVVREGQEKDEESTGLGLSFVREVVEQHGGTVGLDSEVGRGSKFSFTLPRLGDRGKGTGEGPLLPLFPFPFSPFPLLTLLIVPRHEGARQMHLFESEWSVDS
jgi:signal transduction histidine kinase